MVTDKELWDVSLSLKIRDKIVYSFVHTPLHLYCGESYFRLYTDYYIAVQQGSELKGRCVELW